MLPARLDPKRGRLRDQKAGAESSRAGEACGVFTEGQKR